MKANNIFKPLSLAAMLLAGMSLTSCKDQPDKFELTDGTPSVNYIRCMSSEVKGTNEAADTHYTNGELVESASPQSTLCLVGDNLRSVYEIWFNDKKAILNTSYITDNTHRTNKGVPVPLPHRIERSIVFKDDICAVRNDARIIGSRVGR